MNNKTWQYRVELELSQQEMIIIDELLMHGLESLEFTYGFENDYAQLSRTLYGYIRNMFGDIIKEYENKEKGEETK